MIHYKSFPADEYGKKHEITETKIWHLGVNFYGYRVVTAYFSLLAGTLTGHKGYRSDGASGAMDTKDFAEGWFLHDILCDAMEARLLPKKLWKYAADEMRKINKKNGMPKFRRQYTWFMVRFWGRIKPWHT